MSAVGIGLTRRRLVFAGLVLATMAAALAALAYVLAADGLGIVDLLMLTAFLVTLPWTVIGFWNAVIGLLILHFAPDPVAVVMPLVRDLDGETPLRGRTALVMPVFEEDPERVVRHLRTTVESLDATGDGDRFEVFLLSDTQSPEIAEDEARRFAAWQAEVRAPGASSTGAAPATEGTRPAISGSSSRGSGTASTIWSSWTPTA